jgi:hypothetical protein
MPKRDEDAWGEGMGRHTHLTARKFCNDMLSDGETRPKRGLTHGLSGALGGSVPEAAWVAAVDEIEMRS